MRERCVQLAALGGALLLASVLYVRNFADGFLSDDWHLHWIATHHTQPLWRYFLTNYEGVVVGGSYRPIMNVFYSLGAFFGGSPFAYHLLSFFFFLGTIVLVYFLAKKIAPSRPVLFASLAAFFFAIFPNHAEPVIWIGAATDPVCVFFYLLSVVAYVYAREAEKKKKFLLFFGSLVSFAIALGAKEIAISLPVVLFLYELFQIDRKQLRGFVFRILALIPFGLLLISYVLVRYKATGIFFGYYGAPHLSVDPMVAVRAYLSISVSHVLSGHWGTSAMNALYGFFDTRLRAAMLAIVLIAALSFLKIRRNAWWLVLCFFVAIAPVMQFGVNQLWGNMSGEGERYAYLPSVFAAMLFAWVFVFVFSKFSKKWLVVPSGILLMCSVFLVVQLVKKTVMWHEGSVIAEQTLANWWSAYQKKPSGIPLTVGLPDNYRSVPLWRNGFEQALQIRYGFDLPLSHISSIRTVLDGSELFSVLQNKNQFTYFSAGGGNAIVGPKSVTDAAYDAILGKGQFYIYALTYRDFADRAMFTVKGTSTVFFWDKDQWMRYSVE